MRTPKFVKPAMPSHKNIVGIANDKGYDTYCAISKGALWEPLDELMRLHCEANDIARMRDGAGYFVPRSVIVQLLWSGVPSNRIRLFVFENGTWRKARVGPNGGQLIFED